MTQSPSDFARLVTVVDVFTSYYLVTAGLAVSYFSSLLVFVKGDRTLRITPDKCPIPFTVSEPLIQSRLATRQSVVLCPTRVAASYVSLLILAEIELCQGF